MLNYFSSGMNYYHFYFVTLLNGLILVAALMSRKENRRPNLLLSGFLVSVLLSQWVIVLTITGEIELHPFFLRSRFPANLLVPALFYLYIVTLTVPGFKWSRRDWLHFLPFIFGLIIYVVLSLLSPVVGDWRADRSFLVQRYVLLIIAALVAGSYLIACFRQLKRFQILIPFYFSDLNRIRLQWLRILLFLFMVPWAITWIDILTGPFVIIVEEIMVPVVTVIVLLLGFFGLRQSVIFSGDEEWKQEGTQEREARPSFFSPEELARWKERLEKYMEEERPFLEPEYRLVDLARHLGLKPYLLSEILNRGEGAPFFDFINHYRIEEAKRRLKDPAFGHQKILAIAMDCGFNTKSSFNESFRKLTGMTPSEFRIAS